MPMGIVNDRDFDKEFDKFSKQKEVPAQSITPSSIPASIQKIETPGGRASGDVNVPDSLRKVIGETAITDGRKAALDLAHSLGISDSSVSAYAQGATSTSQYNSPTPGLANVVKSAREKLAVKARNRLNSALNAITQEKLDSAKLRDISGVATAMATVIRTMESDDDNENDKPSSNRPTVILFAPQMKREEDYVTITINE